MKEAGKLPGAMMKLGKSKWGYKNQLDSGAMMLAKKIASPTITGQVAFNKQNKVLRGMLRKGDVAGMKAYMADQKAKIKNSK